MHQTTHIEISKSALQNNIAFIQSILGKNVCLSSVIKGNAYGHSIELMVPLLEACGITHFSVFNGDEALRVHTVCSKNTEIMVMGMLTKHQLEWAIHKQISFFVFDVHRLKMAIELAKANNTKACIHLELETGMNRTGITQKEFQAVVKLIKTNEAFLTIKGICTHFAGAESIANYYRVKTQHEKFKRLSKKLNDLGIKAETRHIACSAAALRYPTTQLDMARIGIMQYGFFPNQEVLIDYLSKHKQHSNPLKRILTWKSQVMGTKEIKRGEFVGYGTSFFASNNMKIANIPVGYSYGFSRSLSNHGRVIVNGEYAPVIGIVNMNMMSIDITDIPKTQIGDEVVLIGKQGEKEISVASFSDFSQQINYELLTRLPLDIPRIVVD